MAKKESKAINKKEKNSKDKTSFFKGFKAELKKVSWPTPKQLVNNTVAVVVIVLILAAIVFVLDFTFEAVNKYGIDKIKEGVISSKEVTNENSNGENNTEQTENGNTETVEPTTDANTEATQEAPAE